ncbi:Cobalamin-binding protein [Burkholderiales bacterium]|nr:Cobalamin-binding protein [Burkholderiales bacterium]
MKRFSRGLRAGVIVGMLAAAACARAYTVIDDSGRTLSLARPAERIVSLSPGITELLFALGVGNRVVAVSEFSDYPAAARSLPRVARAQGIDLERIAALQPDLVVVWGSGYAPALLEALRRLAVPMYVHEPRTLDAIARSIERLGELTASDRAAAISADFRSRLAALHRRYARRVTVRVFYQVWANPIMTLSGKHLVSELMRTCGASNIFEDLGPLVATVDIESVIAARPEVIIAAEPGGADRGALAAWRRYPQLPAVANDHLVTLDADELDRATVRILDAAAAMCEQVDRARP